MNYPQDILVSVPRGGVESVGVSASALLGEGGGRGEGVDVGAVQRT